MVLLRLASLLILVMALPGCDRNARGVATRPGTAAVTNAPNPPQLYLDHAQPRLATIKLWIGAQEMLSELARTQTEIATGMMYRKQMGESEGMLFVFPHAHRTAFYMRNTIVPLSAAYIDAEGTILEIHDFKPLDETPIEAASDKVQYVLETPQGWFKKNGIGIGTLIRTERGSLFETFFKRGA